VKAHEEMAEEKNIWCGFQLSLPLFTDIINHISAKNKHALAKLGNLSPKKHQSKKSDLQDFALDRSRDSIMKNAAQVCRSHFSALCPAVIKGWR